MSDGQPAGDPNRGPDSRYGDYLPGNSQFASQGQSHSGLGNAAIIVAVVAIAFSLLSTVVTFMLQFAAVSSIAGASWIRWVVALVAIGAIVLGAMAWARPSPGRLRGAVAMGVGCLIAIPAVTAIIVTLALTL
jgi:hypothetical protein